MGKKITNYTHLSEYELKILDGLLISDASIVKEHNNPNRTARFQLTTIHKEFANHIENKLPLNFSTYYRKRIFKSGSKSNSYTVQSRSDLVLEDIYLKWYKYYNKTIKIIPIDYRIDPISVLYWFLGDGCCSVHLNKYPRLSLATDSFTTDENLQLIDQFKFVGIKFNLSTQNKLYLSSKKEAINFFNYVPSSPVDCFNYKWRFMSLVN